jgi:hypothetical protein
MTIKNKKHGTNTIAYRNGASIQRAIIPGGSVVSLVDLIDLSQVINTQDFNRGWFEVVSEVNVVTTKIEKEKNSLDKAKKEVEEYTEESSDTKDKKIKNNK